jgi:hypothetical protein
LAAVIGWILTLAAAVACGVPLVVAERWRLALIVAGSALVGGLGVFQEFAGGPEFFSLGGEKHLNPIWSAALLFAGAAGAAQIARDRETPRRGAWLAVALVFAYMGADDTLWIHERLEQRTGTDWEKLYALPVALVAVTAGVLVALELRRLRPLLAAAFLVGGGMWFVAQVLEEFEWNGDEQASQYTALYLTEELLEIWGSALFAVAVLTAATLHRTPAVGRRERAPAAATV